MWDIEHLLWKLLFAYLVVVGVATVVTHLAVHAVRWAEKNRLRAMMPEGSVSPLPLSWKGVRTVLEDVVTLFWIIGSTPFGWIFPRITEWLRQEDGRPIMVLVHGFSVTSSSYLLAWFKLRWRGYRNVTVVNLAPSSNSLEYIADCLAVDLRRLSGGRPRRIFLVAKSMGGLAIRTYMERHGHEGLLAGAVTLGSPLRGTLVAALGWGVAARQMQPKSRLIQRLNANPVPPCPVVAMHSTFDAWVIPEDSAIWPEAERNLKFDWLGHNSFQNRDEVLDELVLFYEDIARRG